MDWLKPILGNTPTQGCNKYGRMPGNYGLPITSLLTLMQSHNLPKDMNQNFESLNSSQPSLKQNEITEASQPCFYQNEFTETPRRSFEQKEITDVLEPSLKQREKVKADLKVTFDDMCPRLEEVDVKPTPAKRQLGSCGDAFHKDGHPIKSGGVWVSAVAKLRRVVSADNSWYRQNLINKRLGQNEPQHHLPSQIDRYLFPDSSYESSSEYNESEGQRLVLCQQATLNERRYSPKPCVVVPHPATTKLFKTSKTETLRYTDPAGTRQPAAENQHSAPGGGGALSKTDHDQGYLSGVAQSRMTRKKASVMSRARSKRVNRSTGIKRKFKKEEAAVANNLEDDTTFSEVSPWNSFSCASPVDKSENGSTITAIYGVSQEIKKQSENSKLKGKSLSLVKKKTAKSKTKKCEAPLNESKSVHGNKIKLDTSVQTSLSGSKLHSDKITNRDEIFGRLPDSATQRLKNIACCRALPAPPSSPTDNKLPEIKRLKSREDPGVAMVSMSSGDHDPVTRSQYSDETSKSKFTTVIEAVRFIDRERGRKSSSGLKFDMPWSYSQEETPITETVFHSKSSHLTWSSTPPSRFSSRPSSAMNSANNAIHVMSLTKPPNYDPVELLRRFRENLSNTRGKGLGALARTETSRPRKPSSIKSIMRSLQRTRKHHTLVPLVSCISHDSELAFFKTPFCVKKKPGVISKPKNPVPRAAPKTHQPQKKKTQNNKMKKPNQIFKKTIYL